MNAINPYLKAIVAILGAGMTAAAAYYGGTEWFPILSAVVTAATVYLVPNTPSTPVVTKVDINSAYGQTSQKDTSANPFGS